MMAPAPVSAAIASAAATPLWRVWFGSPCFMAKNLPCYSRDASASC
ncbi:hypothetical protein I553_6429 [Mycobacterium xenopi 4042]|uniref:Uncharacterized protein n=1 Tax=Mycobacterium xenopi 4042 TaxID=1299334 RepID=X8BFB5_MYCXE|nr:hypothetical protein I553_6429 [Mycobacterium xenopi 4042]